MRVDRLLTILVVAFGFLAGSFVARNSDLWLHLASGRLLASGGYSFGVDPFGWGTEGLYWANHSWLADLGMYWGFYWLGGGALVAFKAALVAAIAGVMLLTVGRRGPTWLTAGCILVALLAMSPRLVLHPTLISYLFLAACLYCLQTGGRALRAVPVLIALWVNLDAWFILGPILVVLFLAGHLLEGRRYPARAWPRWLVPASVLACVLSPHHLFAITLPMELSPGVWASGLTSDPRLAGQFQSPWHWGPLGPAGGYQLSAWAFFFLLGLGLISFALNRAAIRSWRGVVWLPFVVLAGWQARLIPFFAVVAGPITALNFGERIPRSAFARSGRAVVLASGVVLVGLGMMGWTVGFRNRDRGLAWAIHADATLERAAKGIADWRRENQIPADSPIATTHPDLGHYVAWFAPGEKATIDSRLRLYRNSYGDYAALSRAMGLVGESVPSGTEGLAGASARPIAAVALYDPDFRRMADAIAKLGKSRNPNWTVARIDGAAILVVPAKSSYADKGFDPERAVYLPPGDHDIATAETGPAFLTEPAPFWKIKLARGRWGSWEADAATIFLRFHEERAARENERVSPTLAFPMQGIAEIFAARDSPARSPALPLLMVRAARRGVERDPADAIAWLMLGRAYVILNDQTWEGQHGAGLTLLGHVRLLQATTALVQASLLNPDSAPTHQILAGVYFRRGSLDLAHRHASAALRLVRRAGSTGGESDSEYANRIARIAELADRIEAALQNNENRFLVRTLGMAGDPLGRARIAYELGLPQKAIDILIQSHPDLYRGQGIALLIDLLLQTGQVPEARVLLDRDEIRRKPEFLGMTTLVGMTQPSGHRWAYQFPAHVWFTFCEHAASGRYGSARQSLEFLAELFHRDEEANLPMQTLILAAEVGQDAGLSAPFGSPFKRLRSVQSVAAYADLVRHTRLLAVNRADLITLGAVLELERGNPDGSAERFKAALDLYESNRAVAPALPGLALARQYLDAMTRHRR